MPQPEPLSTGEEAFGAVRCGWMTRRGRAEKACRCAAVQVAARVSLAGLTEEAELFIQAGSGCLGNCDVANSDGVMTALPIKY